MGNFRMTSDTNNDIIVDVPNAPDDGDQLVYQLSSNKWTNQKTSSGGVSSVKNTDGTLTFSPTSGNVVGSLNLANANTWTTLQTFNSSIVSSGNFAVDSSGNVTTNGSITIGSTTGSTQNLTISGGGVIHFLQGNGGEAARIGGLSGNLNIFNNTNTILDSFSFTSGLLVTYNQISTKGLGLSPLYGLDNRTGITTADASAITLYTTTAAGQLYRINARAFATAGTSATYVVKWTEGSVTNTQTLSVTALDTEVSANFLVQPDNGTAITAQITAISSTTLNVATSVEQLA